MMAAIVVTLYFSSGGLKSAAVVNIIELAVILVGFIVAAPYALNYVGGWNGLETKIAANLGNTAKTASYFSWNGMGNSTILGYFLMLTPAFCISPGLIGKVYSAKDEPAIRKGTLLNGIVQLFLLFPDAHRHVRFCGVSGSFQPGTGSAQGDEGNDALWHFGTGSFRYFCS